MYTTNTDKWILYIAPLLCYDIAYLIRNLCDKSGLYIRLYTCVYICGKKTSNEQLKAVDLRIECQQ